MALVINLKPGERVIIGDALVTNDGASARLTIQGDVPILRKKDIMLADDADTPCKKLYLAVQLMYVSRDPKPMYETYFTLARQIQDAAPSTAPFILAVNEKIIAGAYFQALKEARNLIEYENNLLCHV
jgi:flagellar protein FlbT